jgi:HK97 family phage major capsid protein
MLTNAGTSNAIRRIARVVTLTSGNAWNGVTSAGVTASWDAELTEVSDDSPSFTAVSVPVYKAQAFVQASVEAFEDVAGLQADVLMMFADARDRLEGAAHATGSGSGQPTGIFTTITGSNQIVSTTAATIGLVDLDTVYYNVPARFRANSTWVMNPKYALAIKDLGTAVSASFSGDLSQGTSGTLLGRPVVESDDAPSTQTTTVKDSEIILGDFSNYLIVDKPGSTAIEFIPHLFNTANNLPDGRRGWLMHFRSGADSINDAAFRQLVDKTSA